MGSICLLNPVDGHPKLDLNIESNPFHCDCKDYDVLSINRYYGYSHTLDKTNCDEPPELLHKKV